MGKITIVYSRDGALIGEIDAVEVTRANGKGSLSEPGPFAKPPGVVTRVQRSPSTFAPLR